MWTSESLRKSCGLYNVNNTTPRVIDKFYYEHSNLSSSRLHLSLFKHFRINARQYFK